ncbi:MAG: LysE family transporter [Microthrixaceae bacterium]|nr:LysE family transporter [Microthrixaceae bacterium]
MNASNVFIGLATGIPVMIVVGPVALLLVEQGMRHGFVGGIPAAAGVATTDFSFSAVAAAVGAGAARVLEPAQGALHLFAFAVLALLAVSTFSSARRDLVTAGAGGAASASTPRSGLARAATFVAVTASNPITIVVFASFVLSGREGIGSAGWVLGMTLASMLVSSLYLGVGHGLGRVLTDRAAARMRMAGAVGIALLGLWFAFA